MLKELYLKYENGRVETKIIHVNEGEVVSISPKKDKILISSCKSFKYRVPKHPYLPLAIVHFSDKTMIYPSKILCHPKTTLDDIVEVKSKKQIAAEKNTLPVKKTEFKTWEFESSSGGGTYLVTQTPTGFKCNCPGVWRSKERKCKHIKEVETY